MRVSTCTPIRDEALQKETKKVAQLQERCARLEFEKRLLQTPIASPEQPHLTPHNLNLSQDVVAPSVDQAAAAAEQDDEDEDTPPRGEMSTTEFSRRRGNVEEGEGGVSAQAEPAKARGPGGEGGGVSAQEQLAMRTHASRLRLAEERSNSGQDGSPAPEPVWYV